MKKQTTTIDVTEQIQDGERFSRTIKKVTDDKRLIDRAQRLRDKSAKRALDIGLIEPQDLINAPDTDTRERKALAKAKAVLHIRNVTGFHLSDEDIDFINGLPDDETRDVVITELFSKKIAKEYKKVLDKEAIINEKLSKAPSQKAVKFVKEYVESYNNLLQGKESKSMQEMREDAGYSPNIAVTVVMEHPWIANKIEKFHQSIDKLNEYHYMQVKDRKIREQVKVQDMKDLVIDHFLSHPREVLQSGMRDKTQLLRVMNEMTQTAEARDNGKNGAPPIAIQINGDVAKLAMSQDKEKRDHFAQSF